MYCQNCGAKMDDNTKFCPFCGYSIDQINRENDKDRQIKDLQEKIAQLEHGVNISNGVENRQDFNNNRMFFLIFFFPVAFLVLFFVLFIVLTRL
jgi:uncharacterized membrane protein YvbJ